MDDFLGGLIVGMLFGIIIGILVMGNAISSTYIVANGHKQLAPTQYRIFLKDGKMIYSDKHIGTRYLPKNTMIVKD